MHYRERESYIEPWELSRREVWSDWGDEGDL